MQSEYFMHKEIFETPEVLERIHRNRKRTEKVFEQIAQFTPLSVMAVSRGTSDNAATFGRYAIEYAAGLPVSLAAFSLYTWYGRYPNLKSTLIIGISQSGETEDVCKVVRIANKEGALTLGITNTRGSTLHKESKLSLLLGAGEERSIAATKTYSATLMVLSELAVLFGAKADFGKLIRGVKSVLKREKEIYEIAERYRFANDFISIGRGFNYATSNETALKMRETSQMNAVSFSAIDFLHGPLASLTPLIPAVFFIPDDETFRSNVEVLKKIKEKGGDVLVVSDVKSALEMGDVSFEIPHQDTLYYPIVNIMFAQLLAYSIAVTKKKNPDKPQFLHKITRGV